MSPWRALLRMAWRDAARARGRSALVLVMIALPVLAVSVAAIVIATQEVSDVEGLDRRLGTADARVAVEWEQAWQRADPDETSMGRGRAEPGSGPALAREVLGADTRTIVNHLGEKRVETDGGVTPAAIHLVDLEDPLAQGFVRLDEGRLPATSDEAFVNHELAGRGPGLGETLRLADGTELTVVGVGEDTSYRDFPHVYALPGAVALRGDPSWLVDAPAPVTWEQVRGLNVEGALVLSRAVLHDPPAEDQLPMQVRGIGPEVDSALVAVAALVVSMVLLEVVLLAGPAFAVTARRQSRTLALLAASGGTPRQARHAILAGGVVLGVVGAAAGVVLGIVLARVAAVPLAQRFDGSWFGPFDVPWLQLLAVAGFGFVAAVLAALVPAWTASRQDVVAVLAGRRGDRAPSVRSPLLGLVLLVAGIVGAWYGANRGAGGEYPIAASAIVSVLGMVLLVPVVVATLARVGGGFPLPVRYAVRDAARHRTRTVPAVAAVAATVAGVVALGIGVNSDQLQAEGTYAPQTRMGDGVIASSDAKPEHWLPLETAARRAVPGATVTAVTGVPSDFRTYTEVTYRPPGGRPIRLDQYGGPMASSNLVAEAVPASVPGLDEEERARAARVLTDGGAVVFTNSPVASDEVVVSAKRYGRRGRPEPLVPATPLPAAYVQVGQLETQYQAVLAPSAARRLGLEARTVGLHVTGVELTEELQQEVSEATEAVVPYASLYVERGYQPPASDRIMLWVLGALGGVLMLGGTLTATFLAVSDSRPDLATLSAVGAAARTRRAVAAAYAVVVGLVGAALGALVGLIPGIAVSYPLTDTSWATTGVDGVALPDHYLAIPWLLVLAVVVALPLVTAAVVALCARSRLPMVARVD